MVCRTCQSPMMEYSHPAYWCPNCGTLHQPTGDNVPAQAERVKSLREALTQIADFADKHTTAVDWQPLIDAARAALGEQP